MDPDIASSYRPISNLPYISKLAERVVTSASLPAVLHSTSCRPTNPLTDLFVPLKQLCFLSTTILTTFAKKLATWP